jgi:hypothetical protein
MALEVVDVQRAIERDPKPLWRRLVVVLAAVAGLAAGIVLSIVTIVLPRKHELSRVQESSEFFKTFDPKTILQAASPGISVTSENQEDRDRWGSRVWSRSFVLRVKAKFAEQDGIIQGLNSSLQTTSRRSGSTYVMTWMTNSNVSSGPKWRQAHHVFTYVEGRTQGVIHVWATGHDDDLTLFLTIAEP